MRRPLISRRSDAKRSKVVTQTPPTAGGTNSLNRRARSPKGRASLVYPSWNYAAQVLEPRLPFPINLASCRREASILVLMGPRRRSVCLDWGPVLPRFLAGTFDDTAEEVSRTEYFLGTSEERCG